MSKKKIINDRIQKLEKGFATLLSLWCVGNTIYWEVHMDYPACSFCLWHRYLYIILSILTFFLISCPKSVIRRLILLIVSIELIINLEYIYAFLCFDSICRVISMADKIISVTDRINFVATLLILIILSVIETSITKKQKRLGY